MKNLAASLGALAAGALAMYYLDPQLGRQRRALLADLVSSGLRGEQPGGPRLQERLARQQQRPDPRADAELRAEIQSRLGRLVSHPRAIDVRVENGIVRLSGTVLASEREGLLLQVQQIPGVHRLVNAMAARDSLVEGREGEGAVAPASA